jgi:hypothetical protein
VVNDTLSGNTAGTFGGGIEVDNGGATATTNQTFLVNLTVASNHSNTTGDGGGIDVAAGTVSLGNSIIVYNTSGATDDDLQGTFNYTFGGVTPLGAPNIASSAAWPAAISRATRSTSLGTRCWASCESGRYALTRLQLRGGTTGRIVATDGRQLLVQTGFALPWDGDVLVPALGIFGSKEFHECDGVTVGKTDAHVGIRVGPWTLLLAMDRQGRYPRIEEVIPRLSGARTTCRLTEVDAAFLHRTVPHLPGGDTDSMPVTIDLDGHLAVRARAEGHERATELIVDHSAVRGTARRLVASREFLQRALALGFTELTVIDADAPVVWRDSRRTYLWMPLDKKNALPPGLYMQTVIDETTALRDSEGVQTMMMVAMRSAGTRPGHAWKRPSGKSSEFFVGSRHKSAKD